MKGVLFGVLETVVAEEAGLDAWDDVLDAAGVEGAYTSLGDYPDGELAAIVVAAAARLTRSTDAVLVLAGRRGFPHLVAHHGELIAPYRDVLGLVEDLDDVIRPEVCKRYPSADPPRFVAEPREGGVTLHDRSGRGLCRLAEGLLLGAGDHFGQDVEVTHAACVRHGADACTLEVELGRREPDAVSTTADRATPDPPDPAAGTAAPLDRIRRLERRLDRERTARRRAERIAEAGALRLYEVNAELDARVAARTRELAEATQVVHEASLAKTRLLAAISHEAFTPVHQARGSLELAATAVPDGWARGQLDRAGDALSAIERLFRNLLVVAEADSRGLLVNLEATSLVDVLRSAGDRWRPRATQQGSLLVADVQLDPALRVLTDELRLRHALDELLHNAVRFTRGGVVRLGAELVDGEVAISVADEGPGLPSALVEHLFEPFAGDARAGAPGGLGLGLAAAARIASSLGGRLERAGSVLGERFVLTLPR